METRLYTFKCNITTEGNTKKHTLEWTIPNFKWLLENQTNREICIDKNNDYADHIKKDSRFQLKIQMKGQDNDLIEIYYVIPVSVFAKYDIMTQYKDILVMKKYHWIQGNKWQFVDVWKKQQFLSETYSSTTLNLVFNFVVLITPDKEEHDIYNALPKCNINSDLKYLLKDSIFSDVTIKSDNGVEFKVHKVILIARSKVLKAHFVHDTIESRTNIVQSPFETEVLQEVLNYIYSDESTKLDDIPEKLLAAADYYQLNGLKNLCEEALHRKLTVENAIETLELAYLHTATNLKKYTHEFINHGQAKEIIRSKGWTNLQSGPIIKDLYEHSIINK